MAAVSIPPSPHAIGTMASRRAPLSNLPNAGNSPFRAVAAAAKRSRTQTSHDLDHAYGQPPPLKKKIVELDQQAPDSPRKQHGQTSIDRAPLERVEARRERAVTTRVTRQQKTDENDESLRQWRDHYRRAFPDFVFYFENVPDDSLRRQCIRGLMALGARYDTFFSKDITHVITTRSLPSHNDHHSTDPDHSATETSVSRTINPSLLEKSADHHDEVPQTKFTFDQPLRKRLPTVGQEFESKKQATGNVDMLLRAKGMGMKVWHMEKLQRILQVILEGPASPQAGVKTHDHALPKKSFYQGGSTRQPNLLQLIKNEQHGRTVKEAVVSKLEIVPFKGPHIYIRDMDEKTKPMMVREYPKVPHREDGEWPQFRSVSIGKCPFIEEDAQSRREAEKKRARELQMKQAAHGTARNRDAAVTRMEPPPYAGRKRALAEVEHNGNANGSAAQQLPEPTTDDCGQIKSVVAGAHGPIGRLTGGEPMASGLQASNITSAIRSQMISSTAAAPGAKAGTSKEIHGLQRKVLERNNGPSVTGLAPSRQVTDMTSAAKCNPRTAKQKAQDRLGLTRIHEDEPSDDEAESRQAPIRQRVVRKERRDPKPGYCENCREKFEDFDEHTVGKRHRKFAMTKDNWKELDDLLSHLGRPLRDDMLTDEEP